MKCHALQIFPYVGTVEVAVYSNQTNITDFVGTVMYNKSTYVTRKNGGTQTCRSKLPNCFRFGGWSGLNSTAEVQHTVIIDAPGYVRKAIAVNVCPNTTISVDIFLNKK